jgi:hypothetical protein
VKNSSGNGFKYPGSVYSFIFTFFFLSLHPLSTRQPLSLSARVWSPETAAGGGATVFSGDLRRKKSPQNQNFLYQTLMIFYARSESGL